MALSRSHRRRALLILTAATTILFISAATRAREARACGCFAPPDPSVPIVQAGERILFAIEDGTVTAHIQVQYSGPAEQFGWILPLPSVPEFALGTDELFAQLIAQTQPKYILNDEFQGMCGQQPPNGAGAPSSDSGESGGSPLVLRATVGPYEYAVLKGDSKDEMLAWLNDNGFFVPAGTADVVAPYVYPGAYFLALKLQKGEDTGDLQPVVVKYKSALPMIPLILTSVAADPNMGILVWILGEHRAIPRNYYHTVINDAAIDWINFGKNYVDVITRAVNEAEGGPIAANAAHQSFVTEYAGPSNIVSGRLDYSGRFGNVEELAKITDALTYVEYLTYNGYAVGTNAPPFVAQFSSQMLSLLERELPEPAALAKEGITASDYYTSMRYWVESYSVDHPELFTDLDLDFDPVALTDDINTRIVEPTLAAGALLASEPYLTRMFTTLSPEEMLRDPTFSFNPTLPDVSNIHQGRVIYYCDSMMSLPDGQPFDKTKLEALIITEQGFKVWLPHGTSENPWDDGVLDDEMPDSRQTQMLREEGGPDVVFDNADIIARFEASTGGGCQVGNGAGGAGSAILLAVAALFGLARRRRSPEA
ncbi:MAG TPA: DUF2330 domain-containing protein [Kofleriaceae bacterium]|nr:DUF2330 domain-containing protein [Kofleriaceae bacterium]